MNTPQKDKEITNQGFLPMNFKRVWIPRSKIKCFLLIFIVSCFFVANQASALIASPARIEIEADPGQKISSELSLVNNEEETKTFYSSVENFEASGETGVPSFVPSEDGLDTWVEVVSEVTLEPGERKEIPFVVDTPADAGVGGHFAAIFWSTKPPSGAEDGQVAVGAKIGVLTFLRVRGEIVEKGEIVEMGTLVEKNLFDSLPVDFYYRFENQGNDRTKPIGELKIKNVFGKVTETTVANENKGSVLPESIRKFFISWGRDDMSRIEELHKKGMLRPKMTFFEKVGHQASNFALGRYVADLSLEYGLEKNDTSSQISFWVFPWQFLMVVFLGLIIFIFGGRALIKGHNRRVIAKAQKEQK